MPINLKTEIPGPKSKELMKERMQYVARGPFHATPIFMEQAHGASIKDVDGNEYIDFASGLGVVNVGHTPSTVVNAIKSMAEKVLHAGFNVTPYESYVNLAKALTQITPGAHAKKTLLVNSGAEAVENAIKIARSHTGRQAVVCFDHAFHGRTYMAMTLTSKVKPYKNGFGPFNGEVYRAPFPYVYRWPTQTNESRVASECFAQFEQMVNTQIGSNNVAAVIIEPVLGEGGFVPAPKEFLIKLQEFCKSNGIVFILDEIQTGFGRTGAMFASTSLGVTPDLITLAKGLGGGMPIAAVVGRAEIMDSPVEGGVGGTYGGNPVACASALAVIEMFKASDHSLLKRSQAIGEKVLRRFLKWKDQYSFIGDVRGLGPMLGLEFVQDKTSKEPNREAAQKLAKYCYEHGVIILTSGTYSNVVRLLVPLVIDDHDLDLGLNILEAGLKEFK